MYNRIPCEEVVMMFTGFRLDNNTIALVIFDLRNVASYEVLIVLVGAR